MNFQQLYYFTVVADEGNISRAAQNLFISQQSLSKTIGKLEDELGVKLFDRSPRLTLTYAGICTLRSARHILDDQRQLLAEIDDIRNDQAGILSIGSTHVRAMTVFPSVLPEYARKYPKVEINTFVGNRKEVWQRLLDRELDLLILNHPDIHVMVESIPLTTDMFCVIIPESIMRDTFHDSYTVVAKAWKKQRNIDFEALKQAPIIFSQGSTIQKRATEFFARRHVRPNIRLQANDMDTVAALCAKGMGITFSYEKYATSLLKRSETEGELFIFPIEDKSLAGDIRICYLKNRYQSRFMKGFIQMAPDLMAD